MIDDNFKILPIPIFGQVSYRVCYLSYRLVAALVLFESLVQHSRRSYVAVPASSRLHTFAWLVSSNTSSSINMQDTEDEKNKMPARAMPAGQPAQNNCIVLQLSLTNPAAKSNDDLKHLSP